MNAMRNTKETLSEQAYSVLKEKLLTLESGAYLSARQFANDIGMSYTPVREAFLRLQSEGALKQIPNVGFFVATMDLSEMAQLFQVRECVEPFVLNKVFQRITGEHITRMREHENEQREALAAKDIARYMAIDIRLHSVLLELYGNQHLISLYSKVREKYMFCSNRIALGFYPGAIDEHSRVIDAIEAGDAELSLELLNSHIDNAKQRMMEGYTNVVL